MGRKRVTIKLEGTLPKDFAKIVNRKTVEMEVACGELGLDVTHFMKDTINNSVRRQPHTGNLADSITLDAKIGRTTSTFSVGNIDEMQAKAPYWRVVNDGGYIPPNVIGYFNGNGNPMAGADGNRFGQVTKGHLLKPMNPIRPMNYIEHTQAWLNMNFKQYIKAKI